MSFILEAGTLFTTSSGRVLRLNRNTRVRRRVRFQETSREVSVGERFYNRRSEVRYFSVRISNTMTLNDLTDLIATKVKSEQYSIYALTNVYPLLLNNESDWRDALQRDVNHIEVIKAVPADRPSPAGFIHLGDDYFFFRSGDTLMDLFQIIGMGISVRNLSFPQLGLYDVIMTHFSVPLRFQRDNPSLRLLLSRDIIDFVGDLGMNRQGLYQIIEGEFIP